MVLQKAELFSGTIKDNIGWGKKDASMEKIIEASKIAQAHDFISGFENGYDTIVAEKGASLSGGQKQRISIARALIRKPEILIFDDSTSALDLKTEANLYKDLNEKMSDTTVIIIAQRVASVRNADKILIINDGIIEAFGPHEELINTSETYIEIYNSQLKRGDD
jgi:ATP-binding cassette subfamily B protein